MQKHLRDQIREASTNHVAHEAKSSAPALTTTVTDMCRMLGVGTSTGWTLISGPNAEIESISIGRRRLPVIASIVAYVERKRNEPHRRVASPPVGRGRRPREAVAAN
jgi:hypothetical protein